MAVQLMKSYGMMTHTYGSGSDTPDADHQSMAEGAMLDQYQPREIAELAAKADEHIVRVYSGRVETI